VPWKARAVDGGAGKPGERPPRPAPCRPAPGLGQPRSRGGRARAHPPRKGNRPSQFTVSSRTIFFLCHVMAGLTPSRSHRLFRGRPKDAWMAYWGFFSKTPGGKPEEVSARSPWVQARHDDCGKRAPKRQNGGGQMIHKLRQIGPRPRAGNRAGTAKPGRSRRGLETARRFRGARQAGRPGLPASTTAPPLPEVRQSPTRFREGPPTVPSPVDVLDGRAQAEIPRTAGPRTEQRLLGPLRKIADPRYNCRETLRFAPRMTARGAPSRQANGAEIPNARPPPVAARLFEEQRPHPSGRPKPRAAFRGADPTPNLGAPARQRSRSPGQ